MAKQSTLTIKEITLIRGILEGKTKQAAALAAYDTTDPNTASAIASATLKKANVQEALQAALSKRGIDVDKIIAPVAKALEATIKIRVDGAVIDTKEDDLEMQLKGHDRAMKILNVNQKDDGGGNTINFIKNANFNSKDYVK